MIVAESAPRPPFVRRMHDELAVVRTSLRSERKRLERLAEKLAVELRAAKGAAALREQGEVLKVQLDKVPRGAESVVLSVPWEPDRRVEVKLQRERSPAQNLERLFRRARGLDKGRRLIAERQAHLVERQALVAALLADTDALLAQAAAIDTFGQAPPSVPGTVQVPPRPRDLLKQAEALRTRVRLELRLRAEATPPAATAPPLRKASRDLPEGVQLFTSPDGRPVLVGRSAAGNDALVTRLLRGRDLWFHVRDRTGAHVALRVEGQAVPDEAEQRACAVLAAHLSGVGKGEAADVQVAPGKHVRKVKGAPAGAAYVGQGRTLRVTVDAGVVDAFYARRGPAR